MLTDKIMNERIKELVKQAGFFVLSNGKIYIPTTSEEITDCQIKFAELIVGECISKCDGNGEYKNHTDTEFGQGVAAGITIAKAQIQTHFGVE